MIKKIKFYDEFFFQKEFIQFCCVMPRLVKKNLEGVYLNGDDLISSPCCAL